MGQRGTALVAVLVLMMILLPLGAYVVVQCRSDLMIERNLRSEIEAFYVAEAGLEHAMAEIPPGRSFEEVLTGPDHILGTADDGLFPFHEGWPNDFPYSPFRYEVRVASVDSNAVRITSRGAGRDGATKVIEAVVRRAPLAFTPAALYTEGGISGIDLGSGDFLLSGLDHLTDDPASAPTGPAAPTPALASPQADAELALRRPLPDDLARRLLGAGGPPSIATTLPLGVQNYASRFVRRADCVTIPAIRADESATLGAPEAPQISVVDGDADIAGRLTGNGALVIRGTLHVSGRVDFTGIVIALGGVVFDASSNVSIHGALWRAASEDERLELRGAGAVMYSSEALGALDTAFPDLLPHAAVVAGWQEQL